MARLDAVAEAWLQSDAPAALTIAARSALWVSRAAQLSVVVCDVYEKSHVWVLKNECVQL
jgi:hypothetical protein